MAIKIRKFNYLIIIFVITGFTLVGIRPYNSNQNKVVQSEITPHSSSTALPDKVYTFLAPSDSLIFENISLSEKYMYNIFVKLVTPHVGKLTIKILDPLNRTFDVFESEMYCEPQGGQFFTIPFGTVINGSYKFTFQMSSDDNLNLYIRITREIPCLHDKISPNEIARTILYRTTCFFDGMIIEHQFYLDTDYSYKFYIGRVSAISFSESSSVWMNYGLTNPDDVFFVLFENDTVANVDDISKISFGTSSEGVYTARINIRCEVQYVNIAYAVVRINQISDIVDPNQTQPIPQNETNSQEGTFYLPSEWLIGLSIGASIIIVIVIVSYLSRKKR